MTNRAPILVFPIILVSLAAILGASSALALSFDEFKKITSIRALIPSANGKESIVLASQPGDPYSRIYRLDHNTRELTLKFDAGQNVSGLFANRDRSRLYVLIDNSGDENYAIHHLDSKTWKTNKIFGNKGFKATPIDFSRDGKTLFLRSNHQNKKIYSLFALDIKSKKAERLTDSTTSYDGATISFDGKMMALYQAFGNNEVHLHILDIAKKKTRPLIKDPGSVFWPSFFSQDNKHLYLNTDTGSDRKYCARIPVAGGKVEKVLANPKQDLYCRYDDRYDLTFMSASFDGRTSVELRRGVFGKTIATPLPSAANISGFQMVLGTSQAIAKVSAADSPGDYYTFDLNQGKKAALKKITKLNRSRIADADFAKSYDLKYQSYDKREIHGIVFAKEDWVKGKRKRPAIVWPHGGPDSHQKHRYSGLFQYWNMNGFVVFSPNFRGSTGYGKKFETLNDGDWGGGHIKDVIWGKRALAKLPYVDSGNIFMVGASFGGFSTLSAISQFPREFRGAVAIVALANLFTFMKSIPPDPAWQAEFLKEVGDPVKDKALYRERSPYFHADKVQIPLKIYQAENDVRTVKAEMDQYVAKLRKLKIPVQYEILEKDGHGISRTENQKKVFEGTIEFLNQLMVKTQG